MPPDILRHLGMRCLPSDERAEKVAASLILERLKLCSWRLEHRLGKLATKAR